MEEIEVFLLPSSPVELTSHASRLQWFIGESKIYHIKSFYWTINGKESKSCEWNIV